MKFYTLSFDGGYPRLFKFLLVLKLVILLLFASILQLHATAYGQKVTLNVTDESLQQVFSKISSETGYDFLYNSYSLEHAKNLTLNLKNVTLEQALAQCFSGQPLSYTIKEKTIVVASKKETAPVFPVQLFSQDGSIVKGVITSITGEPIANATVVLFDPQDEKKIFTGTITKQDGQFSLFVKERSSAVLLITAVGFERFESLPFELKPGMTKDFHTVQVKVLSTKLNEVVVSSSRALVQIKPDRTIVNVENSVLAQGSNILDVLGHSPGVSIDNNGGIRLNGKTGVNVTVDGRTTYMTSDNLSKFLSALPASSVKDIELINNPSSKFDAAGAAGVINIQLKKNSMNGLFGNFQTGGQYNGDAGYLANGALNYKSGKWRMGASGSYSRADAKSFIDAKRYSQRLDTLLLYSLNNTRNFKNEYSYFDGTVDYDLDMNHTIGGSVQYSVASNPFTSDNYTAVSNSLSNDITHLHSINQSNPDSRRMSTNAHYISRLDTIGTALTADVDYVTANNSGSSLLSNQYWLNEAAGASTFDKIATDNPAKYRIIAAKIDFTKAFTKDQLLETGIKGSWVKADNALVTQRFDGRQWTYDTGNSNHFIYDENILAAYANYKSSLGKKFSLQIGLRMEYTVVSGNSLTLNELDKTNYLNWFPSLSLQQKVGNDNQLVYSYNRRISRPDYQDLNPFVMYLDPYTSQKGNPGLKPMYTNNFEVKDIFKGRYQLSLNYYKSTNFFNQTWTQDDQTGVLTTTVSNISSVEDFGASLMVPVKLSSWWTTSNTAQLFHQQYKSIVNSTVLDRGKFTFSLNSQHSISLPANFKLEIAALYYGAETGQFTIGGFYVIDAGLQKSLINNKLTLNLNGTDLLRSQKIKADIVFGNINTHANQYNSNQSVRFTLRYNFSRGKDFSINKRSSSEDEKSRIR